MADVVRTEPNNVVPIRWTDSLIRICTDRRIVAMRKTAHTRNRRDAVDFHPHIVQEVVHHLAQSAA